MGVAVALLVSPPAAAQEPTDSERALAREEYRRGVAAVQEERWAEARAAFDRAYRLVGLPEILYNLAGAQAETGLLVEAAESYRRFLREGRGGRAASLRGQAERFLDELVERIPTVRLAIDGLQRSDEVLLDGSPLSSAVVGSSLPVNPGSHVIAIRRGDRSLASEEVVVAEGEQRDVELSVPPPTPEETARTAAGEDGAAGSLEDGPNPIRRPADDGSLLSSPWLWAVVGAVVVGGAVTAVVLLGDSTEEPYRGNVPGVTF